LVAFGIRPTSAETGYGYIRAGQPLGSSSSPPAFSVVSFREKPDRARAEEWITSGEYFWNSGMFVARVKVMWQELARHLPGTARTILSLGDVLTDEVLQQRHAVYASLPSVSLDEGVMEKSERIAVVESAFGWDDVGSWEAASQYWPEGEGHNRVLGRSVALVDCKGCRVKAEGLLVALVGMEDVVVVQTSDAILVCHRTRVQDVKALVEGLENRGAEQYL
jgi:mannose-1-phosphate guanylyltransferase